jgi:hypothetical protein
MKNKSEILNASENAGSNSGADELNDFQNDNGNPEIVSAPSKTAAKQSTFTQNVVGTREVTTSDKKVFVIVMTDSNAEVWVPKSQWNPEAERISFTVIKKGQVWFTDAAGANVIAQRDINQFKACGYAESTSKTIASLKALYTAGFNPSINL